MFSGVFFAVVVAVAGGGVFVLVVLPFWRGVAYQMDLNGVVMEVARIS